MSKDQGQRRFIGIPFSSGCRSQSSVDVVDTSRHAGKKPQQGSESSGPGKPASAAGKGESLVARLLRGFKNLSQIFAVYDEDDDEEEEREMVIGLPTDVKHVAHIGWDGSTNTTTSLRSWNRAAPPEPAAASTSSSSSSVAAPSPQRQQTATPPQLPALSMRQLELAMAASTNTAAAAAGHRRHS